jgi:hypothetical protein
MASLPPFTPGALITDGEPVNATVTNRPIQPLVNRMYEVVNYKEVVITGNYTIQSNEDVMIYVNNTSPVTLTLPLAQNQFIHKRIRIRKVSYNTQTVTVQCASGNTIENRFQPTANPTDTTTTLVVPGDEIELEPQGTIWRVNTINLPYGIFAVGLVSNSTQNISTTAVNLVMDNANNSDFNPLGLWSYTTNKFTAPYAGTYVLSYAILLASGTNYALTTFMDNPWQQTAYTQTFSGGTTAILTHLIYLTAGRQLLVRINTTSGNGSYTNRRVNISYLG